MQAYRTEYSSNECYSSSRGGGHEIGAASMMSLFGGSGGGMTQAQKYRYNQAPAPAPAPAQAHYSNYGMGNYGMNRTSRYEEYRQTYNSGGSHVVPFGGSGGHVVPCGSDSDHMNYNRNCMSTANTHYGGGYGIGGYGGGQYHSNHQQHHAAGGGLMDYNGMNRQRMRPHKRSDQKRMFHKMEAMSVSGSNYSTRSICDDDDEYHSSDGDGSCSDSEHYDSDSDYEGGHRRNYNRPIY